MYNTIKNLQGQTNSIILTCIKRTTSTVTCNEIGIKLLNNMKKVSKLNANLYVAISERINK